MNDFSVAVVPSVYEDPLPRAVIEAMSFGKPVKLNAARSAKEQS